MAVDEGIPKISWMIRSAQATRAHNYKKLLLPHENGKSPIRKAMFKIFIWA